MARKKLKTTENYHAKVTSQSRKKEVNTPIMIYVQLKKPKKKLKLKL